MILFKKSTDLINHLETQRNTGKSIGFVPTMGALHKGHISLIRASKGQCELTVCSIFVNPTQFNDPKDFQKYPSTIEDDIFLLEKNGTDILFLPEVEEIYPKGTKELEHYVLGNLEAILEGQYRPGHFQGVCQVMNRLLKVVNPDLLIMGQKDYQQCKVIEKLLSLSGSKVKFQISPTLREADGLAMSSRNRLLNAAERKNAAAIYQALSGITRDIRPGNLSGLLDKARSSVNSE
jgi:pantoate--beta-alanine ligase